MFFDQDQQENATGNSTGNSTGNQNENQGNKPANVIPHVPPTERETFTRIADYDTKHADPQKNNIETKYE